MGSDGGSKGTFAAMAAVCMSNASQATAQYEQRQKDDAAATRALKRQLRQEQQMYQQLSTMARRAPLQLQEMSNRISGDHGSAQTIMDMCTPAWYNTIAGHQSSL